MGFFICLDIGLKKVGIAVSDQSAKLARDLKTISFKSLDQELLYLFEKYKPLDGLVIGLPLSKGGTLRDAAEAMMAVGKDLGEKFNIPIYFEDERLTSWDARERLKEMGYKPDRIMELEDQVAAKLILQSFLNRFNDGANQPF